VPPAACSPSLSVVSKIITLFIGSSWEKNLISGFLWQRKSFPRRPCLPLPYNGEGLIRMSLSLPARVNSAEYLTKALFVLSNPSP
jgi:hypothetical protein